MSYIEYDEVGLITKNTKNMLIRFTVENFLSFNELTDFNMIASEESRHSHHVVKGKTPEDIDLLKTSILYGANASGKSNLIRAMGFARDFIVHGIAKNRNLNVKPFKLDSACSNKNSRFEFEFRCQGKQYAYGFCIDKTQVNEEWLFETGYELDVPVFERVGCTISFNFEHPLFLNISAEEKQRIGYEARGTRANLLFLTNCQERNIQPFHFIYQWFTENLVIIFTNSKHQALISLAKLNTEFFNQVLCFFDFGIHRVQVEEIDFENTNDIPAHVKDEIRAEFPYKQQTIQFVSVSSRNYVIEENELGNLKASKLTTIRKDAVGNEIAFEISEESEGTQRLMDFIPMLIGLSKDKVFVIDEIERSLHALLISKLFDLILNHDTFAHAESQLIASTHEVNLLDIKNLFRKDEIWFVEKNKAGESVLYSLANTDVDNLNVVDGYLSGKFCAIPFIKDVKDLGWKE
ncbi:MAG: ATP-binding protein [Candidatus Parabeggiatoa sp. nov. 2]|nr:MAG: ATP-binding protein [Gammaproteobacteria bacterium]